MENASATFIRIMKHPVKFRLFLLLKLPSAYFSGVRIKEVSEKKCEVTVPYKWFSKNPFRSTYFACLSMAAEMSTGALSLLHLYKRIPAVSMLVIRVESDYYKKATGKTIFLCEAGDQIRQAIELAVVSGEAQVLKVRSIGRNEAGEKIAEFFITWSFKVKNYINKK
ncbi:MAG: DUF4442 domain-containing protein [Chitinophagaceae bacterium]|nr:DUF4442 domain-containing protein [Chitinophagaceae bacterium]